MAGGVGYHYGKIVYDYLMNSGLVGTWYAALIKVSVTDAGGGTEVTIGSFGYNRVAVTANTTNFPAASSTATAATGALIDWGNASGGNWGTIVAIAFYDAPTGGNLGVWGPLSASKVVNDGDGMKVLAGNGTFSVV